ncbi:dihydroxyacetone kinase subunit DhaK [Streptomyces celluloflavus]|uniref:Dihydroxyacetone kinase subunit DhaK n=1 Tax=Streptomyces kasugaensis TaxID=1946 RepID=A0A4Q9HZV9_STRKA|nr:dihydroxyacetone kinase subunit DhaK [Streptomyces kasugaensis]TBO60852.1 dihydroxyacetone kinase subunit DhaK [Streptomyces kasugaensis]WSK16767.1 dihydroxyacetone kinase subunit DhaK [Streptomyces celluloflavus]
MALYFANSSEGMVPDALAGFARAHADLVVWEREHGFVRARHTSPARRVGLVSGGGSGHEPLHIGYVGAGMLDAACPGRIFASPHNRQIFEASRAVGREGGVLHLVKNYTGDRINFGIAAERLGRQGIPCARVLIDDDVASESDGVAAGRRGTGATVLVEKVLGAAADTGMGLRDLVALGEDLVERCRSLAVASAPHTAPTTGRPAFALSNGALEYGVGIHGERAEHTAAHRPLRDLVGEMTGTLARALRLGRGSSVIALANGLGGVTQLELYAVLGEAARLLDDRGVALERALVGDFVTALDMHGFSLSLLEVDGETLKWYDAPAQAPAWRR